MEFAKDMIAALRDQVGTGQSGTVSAGAPAASCDWHALSARLQAGHAARLALIDGAEVSQAGRWGSFAAALDTPAGRAERGSRGINPSALADGKSPLAKPVGVAAPGRDNGRGRI